MSAYGNTTAPTESEMWWTPAERGLLSTVLLIIMIISIVGNSLVIIVIIRNRGMRTRTNLLLFNLALTDLLASIFDMPLSLATLISGKWIFNSSAVCMLMGFTTLLFIVASTHTLMYMSIHKFFTVRNPHSHALTKRRIIVMNVAAWVWAIITCVLTISGLTEVGYSKYNTQCSPKRPDDVKSYIHMAIGIITCYAVPGVIIGVCSLGVWFTIRSYGRRMLDTSTIDSKELYAQQRHITVTLFLVVTAFVVCWTPFVVYAIYTTVRPASETDRLGNPITTLFGFANSACNPIIYAFRSEAFREGYQQVIWRKKRPRRPSTSSVSSASHQSNYVNRASTMSSTVTVSRNVSNATAALNTPTWLEKDITATTITTLLYDDDPRLPAPSEAIEMELINHNRSSGATVGNIDQHHQPHRIVTFPDVEEPHEAERLAASDVGEHRRGLKSYLSIEHLDDIGDEHRHHRHHHHHNGDSGSSHRKRRKFRGKLGGLHLPRDRNDDECDNEVAEFSSPHVRTGTHPAITMAAFNSQLSSGSNSAAVSAMDTEIQRGHQPIYKKATVGERPAASSAGPQLATVSEPMSDKVSIASSSQLMARPDPLGMSSESRPLKRAATTDWVMKHQPLDYTTNDSSEPSTSAAVRQQRPSTSRVSGDGDSRPRFRFGEDAPTAAGTSRQTSVAGKRPKSNSSRSTIAPPPVSRPENDAVGDETVAMQTANAGVVEPRTRESRTSGRRTPRAAVLDNSRSTDL